jgi:hypothetical protein
MLIIMVMAVPWKLTLSTYLKFFFYLLFWFLGERNLGNSKFNLKINKIWLKKKFHQKINLDFLERFSFKVYFKLYDFDILFSQCIFGSILIYDFDRKG